MPGRRKPKISFVSGEFPLLSETFVLDQIDGLMKAGFDIRILAMSRNRWGMANQLGSALAARTVYAEESRLVRLTGFRLIPYRLRIHLRRWAIGLVDRLALRDADLVICHFGPSGLRAARAMSRSHAARALWTIFHGYDISSYLQYHGPDVYALLFARGARFFAVSRHWIDTLVAMGVPPERCALLRMGVDPDAFAFRPPPASESGIRLLSVCRLMEKKGIEYALRALGVIATELPHANWSYRIIGTGPLMDQLKALSEELGISGRVEFLGGQPPPVVRENLNAADIFVLPSVTAANGDKEGIPVALMEAMAVGVPVATTIHSGIPELVEHNINGLLAPERDVRALADNLMALIFEPGLRLRLAEAGRRIVETEFRQENIMQGFVGLIEEALATSSAASASGRG